MKKLIDAVEDLMNVIGDGDNGPPEYCMDAYYNLEAELVKYHAIKSKQLLEDVTKMIEYTRVNDHPAEFEAANIIAIISKELL